MPLIISAPTEGSVTAERTVTVYGTATPGAALNVAGMPVTVSSSGRFEAALTLQEGLNVIVVSDGTTQAQVSVTVDTRRPEIDVGSYSSLTREASVISVVALMIRLYAPGLSVASSRTRLANPLVSTQNPPQKSHSVNASNSGSN